MVYMLFIDERDFKLVDKKLCINVRGSTLLLFFTTNCKFCPKVRNIFNNLVSEVTNCHIGITNLSLNSNLLQKSATSNTPITYVPLIIFYKDGIPYKHFTGEITKKNLLEFIDNNFESYSQESSFTLGIPKTKEICYFNYDKAYPNKNK